MLQTPPPLDYEIVWEPIPGTSQEIAMMAFQHHILLTGGRGWGKTELQLMRFRSRVGLGYGAYWRGIIFDREYKNLDDIIAKSKRLFRKFDDGATFLASTSSLKWVWPTGEELLLRQAKKADDYEDYHGHEYPFIGWNELTKYPTDRLYKLFMSVNRSGFEPEEHTPRKMIGHNGGPSLDDDDWTYDTPDGKPLPPIPLEVVSTTNPYGAGHNWVKMQFIDVARYGETYSREFNVFDPKTKQDIVIERTQVAIFGSYRENIYLDPVYIAGLQDQTDENILKAWIHGDWDIVAGGAFDDVWRRDLHILPPFKIPDNWYVDRALDWGSTSPFSVGWFAEANGEDVDIPGYGLVSFPKGTLIQIGEYYGSKVLGSNVGLKMGAPDVAKNILLKEQQLRTAGILSETHRVSLGPADTQIFGTGLNPADDNIAKQMEKEKVYWTAADKRKGSRHQGLELLRLRFKAVMDWKNGESDPGLLFMSNCKASISTIPVLPRDEDDPDDIDSDAEDHAFDMTRYRVLKGSNRGGKVVKVEFPKSR